MKKFGYAFAGLKEALKEKSVLTQCVLALLAVIGGIIIHLDNYEWLAFVICIGLVISLEIINSVLEDICNLYSEEYNPKIKRIKDMSAAAVLVASFSALIVCIICVLRRF